MSVKRLIVAAAALAACAQVGLAQDTTGAWTNVNDQSNPNWVAPSSNTPTPSPSPTPTGTPTPTSTVSPSPTATPSQTPSVSATASITPTVSNTPSHTPSTSVSSTNTATATATATATHTASASPTASITPSVSASAAPFHTVTWILENDPRFAVFNYLLQLQPNLPQLWSGMDPTVFAPINNAFYYLLSYFPGFYYWLLGYPSCFHFNRLEYFLQTQATAYDIPEDHHRLLAGRVGIVRSMAPQEQLKLKLLAGQCRNLTAEDYTIGVGHFRQLKETTRTAAWVDLLSKIGRSGKAHTTLGAGAGSVGEASVASDAQIGAVTDASRMLYYHLADHDRICDDETLVVDTVQRFNVLTSPREVPGLEFKATNGFVYGMDQVIQPAANPQAVFPNVTRLEYIYNHPHLTTLAGILHDIAASNYSGVPVALLDPELIAVTAFLPTDDAFAAIPQKVREWLLHPSRRDTLVRVLNYHVIRGNSYIYDCTFFEIIANFGNLTLTMASGDLLNFKNRQEPLLLHGTFAGGVVTPEARTIPPSVNIETVDGLLYKIDHVLVPPFVVTRLRAALVGSGNNFQWSGNW